jgi:hypothetical protein
MNRLAVPGLALVALVGHWNRDIQEAFQRDPERTGALLR